MVSTIAPVLSAVLALASLVGGQTSTSCNPTLTSCPANKGTTEKNINTDFTSGQSSSFDTAAGTTLAYSNMGAGFTINTKTDAPTIETDFYFLFGYVEVKMQAAKGTGIVSSIVLQSDDLDEIDWEFLGGNDAAVQTNFFGKGNTTTYNRMVQVPVTQATSTFHTYALNWTSSSLTWLIDGVPLRTLQYTDALALNGQNYPQTPCKLKLGNWAGGASASQGTVDWAGGATNFAAAPFTMYVNSVKITNYNPASSYSYSDMSGSYTSIKMDGNSAVSGSSESSNSISVVGSGAPAVNSTSNYTIPSISSSSIISGPSASSSPISGSGSNVAANATRSAGASVASFTSGAGAVGRQMGATAGGSKVAFLVMAVFSLFLF